MLALLIVRLGMRVTCFVPSVHDVEHTVPATGDVCVGYVVCITTCLCSNVFMFSMQAMLYDRICAL